MLIDFIIPQFKDPRITRAIGSILNHPAAASFRIIVQDGGKDTKLQAEIAGMLRPQDLHAIEPDRGIFDAINRGLAKVEGKWIGWIGSDDILSPEFNPDLLVKSPADVAFLSYTTCFFKEGSERASRLYEPVGFRALRRRGAHVPHFSTYIRSSIGKTLTFDENKSPFADIFFFLGLEGRHRGQTSTNVSTYMAEGGASNTSTRGIIDTNAKLLSRLRQEHGTIFAAQFVCVKLVYKVYQRVKATITPVQILSTPR